MQRYIAFLGGLPVGRNAVDTKTLRAWFNRLGFLNIDTGMTPGNVAFDTSPVGLVAPLEAQISRHLSRLTGTDVTTFIRTPREVASIVANAPESDDESSSTFVVLLAERLDPRAERRLRVQKLIPRGREVYWLRSVDDEEPPPPLAEVIDGPATVRSLNTIKYFAADRRGRSATESELFRQ